MATRRQPLNLRGLLPGLFAATLLCAVALAAFLALWFSAPGAGWRTVFSDSYLWHVVRFSFWQASLSALLSVGPAIFLARALYRRRFPGRTLLLRLCAMTLILPVLVLIAACIFGLIYTGGFFEGVDFITAFSDCNASAGLVMGSSIALLFTFVFYRVRGVMTFQDFAACIPEGFKAMVSPMLILTLAWTLSGMTNLLGAKYYVANLLNGSAAALQYLLPTIIFLVAVFLAFATGTSWGTFSILIPIVCHAFPQGEMLVISIAACLSGAVCGDHCSPISDTSIMASAGAHCSHVNHVSTQLPYAITAAAISAVCYVVTGLSQMFLGASASLLTSLVLLAVAIVLELVVLNVIRLRTAKAD